MTLVKINLGDDGSAVTLIAWANPDLHKAGDTDGAWSYIDVDMTQEEIDATKVPAAAGAVTLTDKQTGTKTVIDEPAVKEVLSADGKVLQAAKDAVTHEEPIILAGKLVVAADYTPEPEPTFEPAGPSQQDQINAMLTKQLAAVTQKADTAQTAVVALTKQLAASQAKPEEEVK